MFNLSQGRISQIRREFQNSWLEFQRERLFRDRPDDIKLPAPQLLAVQDSRSPGKPSFNRRKQRKQRFRLHSQCSLFAPVKRSFAVFSVTVIRAVRSTNSGRGKKSGAKNGSSGNLDVAPSNGDFFALRFLLPVFSPRRQLSSKRHQDLFLQSPD